MIRLAGAAPAASAQLLEATPERPFLSLALRLDMREIATLLLEGVSPPRPGPGADRRAMAVGAVDAPLLDAFDRLLALLDQPQHAPVLAPLIKREITYRLLTGEAGWRLRQIAAVDSQGHQISRATAVLRSRYVEALRIEDLAREALMSLSSFHHHFKLLTGMSPLQFQKQLRLGEARRLMLTEDLDAATAAYRVGYESASQFSREYGRQFGAPPRAGHRCSAPTRRSTAGDTLNGVPRDDQCYDNDDVLVAHFLAGGSAALAHALHPDLQLLAEPGRTILLADHRQAIRRGSFTSVKPRRTQAASRSSRPPPLIRSSKSCIDFAQVSAGQDVRCETAVHRAPQREWPPLTSFRAAKPALRRRSDSSACRGSADPPVAHDRPSSAR